MFDAHTIGLHILSHGYPALPLNADKEPLIKGGFKSASHDPNQVAKWCDQLNPAYFGVPTGCTGLLVIDLDRYKPDFDHEAAARLPISTVTQTTKSGGQHRFFTTPQNTFKSGQNDLGQGIDTRAAGGYVAIYDLVPFDEIPAIDHEDPQLDVIRKYKPAPEANETDETETSELTYTELEARLAVLDSACDNTKWTLIIHAACEATQGANWAYTQLLNWSFRSTSHNATKAQQDKTTKELDKRWNSALQRLGQPDNASHQTLDRLVREQAEAKRAKPKLNPKGWQVIRDMPEPKWLVQNLVAEGTINLVASEPKLGKSTILMSMIAEAQEKGSFAGRKTTPMKVVWLNDEGLATAQELIRRCNLSDDVDLAPIEKRGLQGGFDTTLKDLTPEIVEGGYNVVVIDTIGGWADIDDFNDYAKAMQMMRIVQDFQKRTNTTIFLVHHQNKSGGSSNVSKVLGSTAIAGQVDTIIGVSKDKEDETVRQLDLSGRIVREDHLGLKFNEKTGRFTSGVMASKAARVADVFGGLGHQYAMTVTEILNALDNSMARNTVVSRLDRDPIFANDGAKHGKKYWLISLENETEEAD